MNISTVIKEIVIEDDNIMPVLSTGLVNLSSYARSIHKEVEKRTLKEVKQKSIIVALSRLAKSYENKQDTLQLKLEHISIHSNLVDISFEKTEENLKRAAELTSLLSKNSKTFFTVTQGITEITIVVEASFITILKDIFKSKSLVEIYDLTGITLKADVSYLDIPKVFYTLTQSLVAKKISIIEIISTTTEMTFIIKKDYAQETVSQLSKFLR